MNPNVKQSLAILERLANEATPPPTIDRQDFLDKFYPKQQKVITDEYRYGTIFGGKRSGKSSVLAGLTFYTDNFVLPDRPGIIFLCSTTAEHAKTLFLKRLQSICKKYRIKNWHYQLSKSRITTPHNLIIFVGLKDLKSVYDQQGAPVKLCIIDEAQFVKDDILKAFIDLVVSLGMFDFHPFSKTVFAGNPFPVHSGYMWDELQNPEIKHFNLNLTDNTFFSEKEKMNFITAELKKRGETMQTLSNNTRRLIFGEHIADHDKLILNFTEKDEFDYLTPQQINSYDCFMGIDLGFDDKTAIACAYYDYISRDIFLDYEFQEQHMTILPLADKIKSLLPSYITHGQNIIDTQGGGKQTAFSLIQDHGIPFIPSKKNRQNALCIPPTLL